MEVDKLSIEIESSSKGATSSIDDLVSSLKGLGTTATSTASGLNQTNSGLSKLKGSLKNARIEAKQTDSTFTSLKKGLSKLTSGMIGLVTKATILNGVFQSFFEESSAYAETLNKLYVTMGVTADAARDYAQTVEAAMGINQSEWLDNQATFSALIKGFEVSSDMAAVMSQNLTQLAYDYSSLFNVSASDAADKLASAMSGQIKGLKEYGNNASVAMVKQTALKYGLEGSVSDWDNATQAIMRYQTIMENATDIGVFNDMARTINTPANSVRILTNQFSILKRTIGGVASVIATAVIPYIQIAVQAVNALAKAIASLFGYDIDDVIGDIDYSGVSGFGDSADEAADSVDSVGDSADTASKKVKELKDNIQSFDEFHLINDDTDTSSSSGSGSGSGGSGGLSGLDFGVDDLITYDFLDGLNNQATETIEDIKKQLEELFKPITNSWDTYGESVFESIKYNFKQTQDLTSALAKSFGEVWQNGTGEATFDYLLATFSNLEFSAGNLKSRFKEAWTEGEKGTKIIQNLWNALNDVLSTAYEMSESFKNFTYALDFNPMLTSTVSLSDALESLANVIGGILQDGFDNVLLPLSKWAIETGVPKTVSALSDAIKGVSSALSALEPIISVLETLAVQIAKATANTIISGIQLLANGLKLLGERKALVVGLATALSTLFAATKIQSFISNISSATGILSKLGQVVLSVKNWGLASTFKAWALSIQSSNSNIGLMAKTFNKLNDTKGILSGVSTAFGNLASKITGTGTATSALSSVFSFLSANPLVAVVAGVGLAVTAFTLLSDTLNSGQAKHEKLIESIEKETSKLKETTDQLKSYNDEAKNSISSINEEATNRQLLWEKLSQCVDENGKLIKSQEETQYWVDQVNEAFGTSMEINDGVISDYQQMKQKVAEYIEQKKIEAKIEAYQEAYVKAEQKRVKVKKELKQATQQYNEAAEEYAELEAKAAEETEKYGQVTCETQIALHNAGETMNAYKDKMDEAQSAMDEITEATDNYNTACNALDGTVESMADLMVTEYERLDTNGRVTWTSMCDGLDDLNDALDENGSRFKNMTEDEIAASKQAKSQIISDLAERAVEQGKSYDDLLEIISSKGYELTATEKAELEKQYKNFESTNSKKQSSTKKAYKKLVSLIGEGAKNMGEEEIEKLTPYIDMMGELGDEQGQSLMEKLNQALIDSEGTINNEVQGILDDIEEKCAKANPTATISSKENTTSTDNVKKSIFTKFANDIEQKIKSKDSNSGTVKTTIESKFKNLSASMKVKKFSIGNVVSNAASVIKNVLSGIAGKSYDLYANGGFPDTGEMFIAREKGAELVGRIGNRTAVANNDQIVASVARGVESAVSKALSANGNGGTFNIHTTVELNQKAIGEAYTEYHNGVVRRTGKSPILT